jgi:hypothetical protein
LPHPVSNLNHHSIHYQILTILILLEVERVIRASRTNHLSSTVSYN